MTWTLVYATSAARAVRRLDPAVRRRLLAALERLRADPERGKPLLLTLKGLRSLRTGDYRIVYRVVESRVEILVVAVGHRRDVYARVRKMLDARRCVSTGPAPRRVRDRRRLQTSIVVLRPPTA